MFCFPHGDQLCLHMVKTPEIPVLSYTYTHIYSTYHRLHPSNGWMGLHVWCPVCEPSWNKELRICKWICDRLSYVQYPGNIILYLCPYFCMCSCKKKNLIMARHSFVTRKTEVMTLSDHLTMCKNIYWSNNSLGRSLTLHLLGMTWPAYVSSKPKREKRARKLFWQLTYIISTTKLL